MKNASNKRLKKDDMPPDAETAVSRKSPLNILVAEDSKTQARQMKNFLQEQGFAVTVAENGLAALEQLKAQRPDLVISDVVMPGMNGYDLCRSIRQNEALEDLPVMLLTSLSEPEDVFRGLDCGADNFVAKPFDPEYLLNRIQFLVANANFQKQDRVSFGIEVLLGGRRHFVSADRVQILHHLLSTYETALIKTRELEKTQRQLRDLNARLEAKVRERTAALEAKIEEREKAQKDLAYRLHLEETLASVSSRLVSVEPESLDAAIEASLQEIGEAMDVDSTFFWLVDEKENTAVQSHLWSRADILPPYERGAVVAVNDYSWWFDQMQEGHEIAVADMALLPPVATAPNPALAAIRSILVVPLLARQHRLIGVLGFATFKNLKEWLPADITVVQVVIEVLGKALEHRKEQELTRDQANLLDLATDAIVVRGMDGEIQFWNRGAEKLYGWRRQEVFGKPLPESFWRDHQQFAHVRAVLLEKGEWQGEMRHIDPQGRELTVSKNWTLVRDAEGKPKSILSIGTDVTERKAMERSFYQAQKQESIGSLAGGIAHDFNNLLAVINGYSEMLIESPAADPKRFAKEILGAGRRAEALVRQILTFARKTETDFQSIEVGSIIEELLRVVTQTFPRRIKVEADLDTDLPLIFGDSTQIYQVIMNLLVNARDAIEGAGEIRITGRRVVPRATMERKSQAMDFLCLEVADSGRGMSREAQGRIFDPFFTTKPKGEGTGLGLAVVDGIIKSHGGRIEVDSAPGNGTTFRVFLPSSETKPLERVALQEQSILQGAGRHQLILVVDDEVAIRSMVELVLREQGYQVITAQDGIDALAILQQGHGVDLVISDFDMPRAGGEDLLKEAKKMQLEARFILLSGYLPQERLDSLRKAGLHWHLFKPISIRELLAKVDEVLASNDR